MTALTKKLQMKPGQQWLLYPAPENFLPVLEPLPEGLSLGFEPEGAFNGVLLFATHSAGLAASLKAVSPVLQPDTILWVIYPKKGSGIATDLEMAGSWQVMQDQGFDSVTAAAVSATHTALRFRPLSQIKTSDTCNDELPGSAYSAYVDTANRQVTLPPDAVAALQAQPAALAFYETLSYSNKKEYVLWLLTAKQEKTRQERLGKMVDKLLNNKKNPAEK